MKKNHIIFLLIALFMLAVNGCTLHFKAKDLEIETQPPEARLGLEQSIDQAYELASLDILTH